MEKILKTKDKNEKCWTAIELVLRVFVAESFLDGDRVVALDQQWQVLKVKQEGAVVVIISNLCI